ARDCKCARPPQVEGRAHEIPLPAHLRQPAQHAPPPPCVPSTRGGVLGHAPTSPQFSPGAVATCAGCAPSPAPGAEARAEPVSKTRGAEQRSGEAGAPSERLSGAARAGRTRHPIHRRRTEAERPPPPPHPAVSG